MQLLKFTVNRQIIRCCSCDRIVVSGSRGHVYAAFELDEDWDGLDVTAIFENDRLQKLFPVPVGEDPVEVPAEVLVPGGLRVSLEGISKGHDLYAPEKTSVRLTTKRMDAPIRIHRA